MSTILLKKIVFIAFVISSIFIYFIYSNNAKVTETPNNILKNKPLLKDMEITTETIAKSSAIFLVNFALDELKNKIALDMENVHIRAIVIRDLFLDEDIIIAHKNKKNKILFSEKLPKDLLAYQSITKNIIDKKSYTQTNLGLVTLYYENNLLNTLNLKQKEYLKNKKEIKVCIDPNWFPFEKIENDKHIGITKDYLNIFSSQLGIPITLFPTSTWIESLDKIKNKKCDILSLATSTKKREEYINFTIPYIITPIIIATKTEIPFIDNILQIENKKLGVVKGYSLNETLKEKYPNINIVEVDSIADGLNKVQRGEIFGYLDNTVVVNHEIQKDFLGTISISGKLKEEVKLSIAVRDDEDILREILNKVIVSLSKQTKEEIFNKWVKINYVKHTDYTLVWQLAFITLIIIVISIYWNRKLSILNKQLEIQRDKANEATKMKSIFLANMSHEIRTPMNGIIGMATLALSCKLDEKTTNYIQKIDYSAKLLLHIINDILDFSKMEAGKLDIEKVNFNLKELIESITTMEEQKIAKKQLEFKVVYNNIDDDIFYGDPFRITQVILNLLSNAIKFTHKGMIVLTIESLSPNRYKFEVKDTGIGLEPEEIKKIFNSFTQADSSTTREYGGTGLGLVIARQLVELMNGKITVNSKKGVGSTFGFDIELESKRSTTSYILKPKNNDNDNNIENKNYDILKGLNILLVEDNKINQAIVLGLLENSGLNIDVASNGKEAVEMYEKDTSRYKLILMDIQMPVMSGTEATKIIRLNNKNLPIIALTANAMQSDIEASEKVGMNDHLIKPINIDKLYSTILKYI